jgi:protein O-mannosyl-transferase
VTYVSGRSSSLSALFALGSVLAAIDGLEKGRRALLFGLSPVLFACALGVKEIAVAVPAAILLWCATDSRKPLRLREAVRAVSGHLMVLALAGGLVAASPTYRNLLATSLGLRAPAENLLVQVNGASYLVGQLVRFDRLNADPMVAAAVAWSPIFALKLIALLSVLALGLTTLRARPALAFGILWFVIWLLPTNSLIARLDVANDRQLYLALAGPAWLVGRWVAAIPFRRDALLAAVAAAACVLGVVTVDRNRLYADEVRFWEDVVRKTPENARALNNLGYAYALACRTEDADAAFVLAVDLAPDDPRGVANLTLLREGALLPPAESRCVGG